MNFLNNKYGYANGIGILLIIAAGVFDMPGYFKGLIQGFGFCLFFVTLYLTFKLMGSKKNEAENAEE
ncbi:hypothetical protein [Butyrivibrio sp. YAB3001]|uniref:hypothetical protein n=1 Tax=Butyrivibrio sp. YAB3001 TaxID=1520812 RepID=UPI0008F62170|nr:hypothetical protein [Butyrivibrio sp. YAB3001]SFC31346.1 hypothetical protein SAMN02910398_01991 [Butyrivibrio sp. YAB3001]